MDNKFKMADAGKTIEMTVTEQVAVPEVPVVETTQSTLTLGATLPTQRPRAFYVTSYWHIEPAEGVDMINAVNNNTGDRYSGTIADFNGMLRGN
jgi:hypothetical protein